jgi:hypothetical protein
MTHTRLQNYTNMVVGEHGIETSEAVVVVLLLLLSFDVFVLTSAHPLFFMDKCTLVSFMATSSDVMYYSFAAYKIKTSITMETLPLLWGNQWSNMILKS